MKPYILSIILILIGYNLSAQKLFIDKKRKDVEKGMTQVGRTVYKIIDSADTLAYVISPDIYPVEFYCIFDDDDRCHQQLIKIYCSKCAKSYLKCIKNNKGFDFKRLSKYYYYSKRKKRTLMRVVEDEEFEICVKIILDRTDWSKDEYKKIEERGKEFREEL